MLRVIAILATIVLTMTAPQACAPTPNGSRPNVASVAREVKIICRVQDTTMNNASVSARIVVEAGFNVAEGRINAKWPSGPNTVEAPWTGIVNISPGAIGVHVWANCTSPVLISKYKLSCDTYADGLIVDSDEHTAGNKSEAVVEIACEYIGP